MARINLSLPHTLDAATALEKIKGLLKKLKEDHGGKITNLVETWTGNACQFSFKAKGYNISGTMTVNDHDIKLEGDGVPFLLKGLVESTIKRRATELLK